MQHYLSHVRFSEAQLISILDHFLVTNVLKMDMLLPRHLKSLCFLLIHFCPTVKGTFPSLCGFFHKDFAKSHFFTVALGRLSKELFNIDVQIRKQFEFEFRQRQKLLSFAQINISWDYSAPSCGIIENQSLTRERCAAIFIYAILGLTCCLGHLCWDGNY